MDIRLNGTLCGAVIPPPSKSQAHRLLICAALGADHCLLACGALNDDLAATMNCLNALGADIVYREGVFDISPIKQKKGSVLDCGESGSTLRFLLSVAAVLGADATFIGKGKLPQRPNSALYEVLSAHGINIVRCSDDAELPLKCTGVLQAGKYVLSGSLSSQYLTGLLLALPLAAGDSVVRITGTLASASYIDMTLDAVRTAGIKINCTGQEYHINGRQRYALPLNLRVEGDWSAAAFWIVAGVIGKRPITVSGMNLNSLQGDRCVIDYLRMMGAFIEETSEGVVAMPSQLFGAELDCMDTPDLVPILSVAAAVADGNTLFTNVGRLRFKESDRLSAMKSTLESFGISSQVGDDTFIVHGGRAVACSPIDCYGDHRIAMSAAILSTVADGITTLHGVECVAKSYPHFFDDFAKLGGTIYSADINEKNI